LAVMLERVLEAIDQLVRDLPPITIEAVARKLDSLEHEVGRGDLLQLGMTEQSRKRIDVLEQLLVADHALSSRAVALALRAALYSAERIARSNQVEIAWTGPETAALPKRRVDQVMYELVEAAERNIVLASYVTAGAESALSALHAASQRGVQVTLILERAEETAGKLRFDGLSVVRQRVPQASIYYWPFEKRDTSMQGKIGIFHAKCLVCDEAAALISSANLTDYALELNMELGVVLRGGDIPSRLAGHFRQLIHQGDLVKWE